MKTQYTPSLYQIHLPNTKSTQLNFINHLSSSVSTKKKKLISSLFNSFSARHKKQVNIKPFFGEKKTCQKNFFNAKRNGTGRSQIWFYLYLLCKDPNHLAWPLTDDNSINFLFLSFQLPPSFHHTVVRFQSFVPLLRHFKRNAKVCIRSAFVFFLLRQTCFSR